MITLLYYSDFCKYIEIINGDTDNYKLYAITFKRFSLYIYSVFLLSKIYGFWAKI